MKNKTNKTIDWFVSIMTNDISHNHAESTPLFQHNRDVVSGNQEGEMLTTTTTTTMTRRSATFTVRFVMLLLCATATATAAVMIIVAVEDLGISSTTTTAAATAAATFQTSMAVVKDAWPYLYDSSTDPLSSSTTAAVCHPGTEAWECDGIVHCLPCLAVGFADVLHDVCVRGPTPPPAGDDPCGADKDEDEDSSTVVDADGPVRG